MRKAAFLRTALSDFRHAGTLLPSSQKVSDEIGHTLNGHRFIVEYGAGDGAVTHQILRHMPADGKLLALEINEEFADALAGVADARLSVKRQDVIHFLHNGAIELPRVEAVVSGIPLSFLEPETRAAVMRRTKEILVPGGTFVIYQASPFFFPLMRMYFPNAKMHLSLRNLLPPYFIAVARNDVLPDEN
jgi:phospholipid N-methyltransferase